MASWCCDDRNDDRCEKYVRVGYTPMKTTPMTVTDASRSHTDRRRGARSDNVTRRAGLAKGDTILEFGGEPVSGVDDLHRLLIGDHAGRAVSVRLLRAGRSMAAAVTPEPDA